MYRARQAHAHRRHPSERAFLLKESFSTHFSWSQVSTQLRSIVRDSSLIARSSRSREKSAIYKIVCNRNDKHGNDAGSSTEDHQVLDVRFQLTLRSKY